MQKEIQRIKNQLVSGGRKVTVFGRRRFEPLTPGRKKMLEKQLRALEKRVESARWLWKSVEPIKEWDNEKKVYVFKGFRKVGGTYNRTQHGELRPS